MWLEVRYEPWTVSSILKVTKAKRMRKNCKVRKSPRQRKYSCHPNREQKYRGRNCCCMKRRGWSLQLSDLSRADSSSTIMWGYSWKVKFGVWCNDIPSSPISAPGTWLRKVSRQLGELSCFKYVLCLVLFLITSCFLFCNQECNPLLC